jgi:pSer/pThr/pTyr-binding forkhead associated (FHA) protein
MSLALLGLRGLATGKVFNLPDRTILIGRHPENDIALVDLHIARRHFRIMLQQSRFVIEDLASATGTTVNGKPILRGVVPIQPGDIIDAGRTRFVVIIAN